MLSDFHWDDIRFFLTAQRLGSYSAAAKRLGVSHTTVARHLERLERQIGAPLFERTAEGLAPSEAGQQIIALAGQMESAASAIADRLGTAGAQVSGTVRIGAPDGIGNAFLSSLLPLLQREQPALTLELVPVPITHKLWKREADIAISLERPESGHLVRRKLTDYDLRLYGAPALLADLGTPERLEDLRGFGFVSYIDDLLYTEELDFLGRIRDGLGACGLSVRYKAATVKAQLDAVRMGAGLGVLPCFMVQAQQIGAQEARLRPLLPDQIAFQRSYWLVIPEAMRGLEKIRVVSDFLVRQIAAHSADFRFRP
ncbi:MAG: LysR family transcriptional regulator [Neomegalonema sp.]|nr:LysR family transcriptional regulator [Neomegalonema sp.]